MEAFLAEDFLAGLSTRDLARISGKHLGHRYDSKQISRIVGRATTELEAWRRRSLLQGQRYKFLCVDGANFRVRINGHVARQSFCGVLGVSEENERFEVLALEMGDREQADLWASLLGDLAERGLNLEAVELGIMDGLPGLEAVFQRFFPRAQTRISSISFLVSQGVSFRSRMISPPLGEPDSDLLRPTLSGAHPTFPQQTLRFV